MYTDEVCHLSIHLFPIEQLESQVLGTTAARRTGRFLHHIVKVHLTLTNTRCDPVFDGWLPVTFTLATILFRLHIELHTEDPLAFLAVVLLIELHLLGQYSGNLRVLKKLLYLLRVHLFQEIAQICLIRLLSITRIPGIVWTEFIGPCEGRQVTLTTRHHFHPRTWAVIRSVLHEYKLVPQVAI